MIADAPTLTVPLRTDEHGATRIGNTRVPLEWVIHAYLAGETPEGIVESYSALTTADVYAVIGYYLLHRAEVDAYVRAREAKTEQLIDSLTAKMTPETQALRTRLRAFREQRGG